MLVKALFKFKALLKTSRHLVLLPLYLGLLACTPRTGMDIKILNSDLENIRVSLSTQSQVVSGGPSNPVTIALNFNREVVINLASLNVNVVGGTLDLNSLSGSGSSYNFQVFPNADGPMEISIPAQTLSAKFGQILQDKQSNRAATNFIVDSVSPLITLSTDVASPTNLKAIPVKISINKPISNLKVSDIVKTGAAGSLTDFSGSNYSYQFTLKPEANGQIVLKIPAHKFQDAAGNWNVESNELTITYANTLPIPNLSSVAPAINNSSSIPVVLEFKDDFNQAVSVTGLVESAFITTNASIQNFTGSGGNYIFNLVPTNDGLVSVKLPASLVQNSAGFFNVESNNLSFTVDRIAPTMTIAAPTPTAGNSSTTFTWAVTYSGQSFISLTAADVTVVTGGTAFCTKAVGAPVGNTVNVTVTGCTGDGMMGIMIAAGSAWDDAGNMAAAGSGSDVAVDNIAPTMTIAAPTPTTGRSSTTFTWAVTYSGHTAKTLAAGDVTVIGVSAGCIAAVTSINASTSNVTVTGCTDNGLMGISIAAGTAQDGAGNPANSGTGSNVTVDNTPPNIPTVAMYYPASSSGGITNPILSMTGVSSGDIISLYTNNTCSTQVASGVASSSSLNLTTSNLAEGTYNFYVKSLDSAGNSTSCTNTGAIYNYLACTVYQRVVEGTCADPIIVTLGSTVDDPGIFLTANNSFTIEVKSSTVGVVVQSTQGGATENTLTLYPNGDNTVVVSFWPSKINLTGIRFCSNGSYSTVKSIKELNDIGSYNFSSGINMFQHCKELTNIGDVSKLSSALSSATDFSFMFSDALVFNQSLSGLNTSNVTNMAYMFNNASTYNQPLPSSFNTLNVTDMRGMFSGAQAYNQPLPSSFNTSNVTGMRGMFSDAQAYNQPLPSSFNTSNVTDMRVMFSGAQAYNQPLPSSFNTSNVTNMNFMFSGAQAYNQALPSSFDTSNVTDMGSMFSGAQAYNQPLPSSFNTSKVTDMTGMFSNASAYNQPLPLSFDTSNVTNMASMFYNASAYFYDLRSVLDVCSVTNSSSFAQGSSISGTGYVPLFGDPLQCNKGGPP